MGHWIAELGSFLYAVIANWQALVTGGIVTTLVFVYERWREKSIPRKTYLLIFSVFCLYSVFAAWQDEHRNTSTVASEKSSFASRINVCEVELEASKRAFRDKEALAISLQQAFLASQAPQAQQAANINTCINTLAKMNPQVRESIHTLTLPVLKVGQDIAGAKIENYFSVALMTTNIRENSFHGNFKCAVPFTITSGPYIPFDTAVNIGAIAKPRAISDREYEIRVEMSNSVWDAAHPAYLGFTSNQPSDKNCTFERLD